MASSSKKSAAKAKILGKREPEDDLKTKPIQKKHKEKSEEQETTEGFADSRVELSETKSDQANLISEKETTEGLDEPPDFVEEVAARKRKKRLFVGHLPRETKISDIIDFFHNVGGVVRIELIVNRKGEHAGFGFVEFASANEAKKALEKKNGEYLHDHKIFVDVAKEATYPPRYCIEHKVVCYEDYLRRKSLLIEENETVGGHDEDTDSIKEVAIRKKTLFVADLSPQSDIIDVCKFFHNVGQVVSLRLIVNHEEKHVDCGFVEFVNRKSKHVGYGFVEFASANEAKKALEKKGEYLHDHKIFLDVAKIAPYPPRPKYKDYLRQESLLIEEDELERVDEDPDFVEEVAAETKTLFVGNLSPQTTILDICGFFHWVGEVVHVRLNVDQSGKHAGYGFVEFASADEAKKALEERNGNYLHDCTITLDVAEGATYPLRPKYNLAEKLWYEDYLRRESLRIEEDETVEGLVQEVSKRKRTLFLANLPPQSGVLDVYRFFGDITGIVKGIVGQRLIVNHEGKHVGCGFVEFASTYEAVKALRTKNGEYLHDHKIFLDVAKIAPYPPRPKYNLAEKLWYQDYLIRRAKPVASFCGTKTTFVDEEEAEDEAHCSVSPMF